METSATLKEDPCFSLLEPHVASSVSALSRLLGILLTSADSSRPALTHQASSVSQSPSWEKSSEIPVRKLASLQLSSISSTLKKTARKTTKHLNSWLFWKTLQLRLIKLLNLQRCKITLVSYCSKRNWHFVAVVAAAVWGISGIAAYLL